jgi:hypothetical protein
VRKGRCHCRRQRRWRGEPRSVGGSQTLHAVWLPIFFKAMGIASAGGTDTLHRGITCRSASIYAPNTSDMPYALQMLFWKCAGNEYCGSDRDDLATQHAPGDRRQPPTESECTSRAAARARIESQSDRLTFLTAGGALSYPYQFQWWVSGRSRAHCGGGDQWLGRGIERASSRLHCSSS